MDRYRFIDKPKESIDIIHVEELKFPATVEFKDKKTGEYVKEHGHELLFEKVMTAKPKMHLFGHGHHPYFLTYLDGVYFINLEYRVLVWNPIKDDTKRFSGEE